MKSIKINIMKLAFVMFCIFQLVLSQDKVDDQKEVEKDSKTETPAVDTKDTVPVTTEDPKSNQEVETKDTVTTEKAENPDLFKTCFECAALNTKKFCVSDIPLSKTNKNAWKGACCDIGDTSPSCTEGQHNRCSDTYENS